MKEINTFNQQGYIKMIKNDSKIICNIMNKITILKEILSRGGDGACG